MNRKMVIIFDPSIRPVYYHLDPIVDFLIGNGNVLAESYRWGENRTGFYCFLSKSIDFDLLEENFYFPDFIRLVKSADSIECDRTWATIKGNMV